MKLTTDVTSNGETIDITVYEDTNNDGTADNTETVTGIGGGVVENTLNLTYTSGNDYWLEITANTTSISNSPVVNSVSIAKNLEISVDTTGSTSIDLSWTDTGAASYDLYRAETSGSTTGDYTKIADPATTTYSDTSLENGEQYFYRVANDGDTSLSNEVSPTTTLPAPSNLSVTVVSGDQIDLSWTNNDNSTDGTIEVLRSTDGSAGTSVQSFSTLSTTSYSDTGLTDGETYYYTIRRSTDHANSDSSQQFGTTTLPAPSSLSAVSGTNADEVDLSWTKNDDNTNSGDYKVYQSEDGSLGSQVASGISPSATSTTISGLEHGEQYHFTVERDTGDATAQSNQDSQVTSLPTTTPSLDSSVEDQVTISWTKQDNSTDGNWVIYRSQDGTTGSQVFSSADQTTNSYTDTSLTDGEQYYYTLERVTDHATQTSQQSTTTLLPAPSGVTLDTGTQREIGISWTNNDDNSNGSVEIYRSDDGTLGTEITGGLSVGSTTYTDTSLTDGTEYHYTVRRVVPDTSTDSTQVSGTTVLPSPSLDSIDNSTENQLTINWTNNDNNPDGSYEIYRSQASGTTGSVETTITNLSTLSYADTGLEDGERYFYTIRRVTADTSSDSSQQDATTVLPAPSNLTLSNVNIGTVEVSWTNNDDSLDGDIEIYTSTDGSLGTIKKDGLGTSTTSWTDDNAITGDTIYYTVRRQTDHTNSEVQNSIKTGGITGPTETISWRSESDWNEATTIKAFSQDYGGNDKETIRLGFTEEWDVDGLEALYTFDSTDGTLYDRTSNGYDGTPASTLTYGISGPNGGNAWGFDGTEDARVDLPNMGIFGDHDITLLVIFNPNTHTEDQMLITVGGDDDRDQVGLLCQDDCTGYLYSAGRDSFSGTDTRTVNTTDFSGQWAVGALVYDASASEFRVNHNGSNIETYSYGSDMKIHNTRYRIGSSEIGRASAGHNIYTYSGDIAIAAIFSSALSTSTLSDIADSLTYGKIVTEGRSI